MNSISFSDLEFHKKIGQGSFGKVWQGCYLGTPVAIKECLPTEDDSDFDFIKYFEREADLLSKSRHPNIVQFLGTCINNNKFYIVTEYVPCGTMKSWIITDKVNSIKTRLSFAIDIARALTYLHSCNIIHRDLKPSNLLITENQRIKVCDFGFARLIAHSEEEKRRMTFCGTDEYMAPELLQGLTFDKAADIFGFGVILCELASLQMAGSRVFKRVVPGYHIYPSEIEDRATSNCPKELVSLAIKCTLPDPKERPTMLEVLNVLHALEKATSSLGFIHVGIHGIDMPNSDSIPSLLDNISIPDGNLSIHLDNEKNELCTPNLILDSSQISSEPSPYSNYSDIRISHSECSQKPMDPLQEFSSTKNVLLNSLSLSTTELPSILQSPLQNLLIGESNITLGRTALPKIDSSHSVANFSSIGFSKIRHEGLGLELIEHFSDEKNSGYGHRFSIQSVNGLDTCKYCQQKLSDFLKATYGMVCDDCGLICHKRCASLAPYNCDAPSPALKSLASLFTQNSTIKSNTVYS